MACGSQWRRVPARRLDLAGHLVRPQGLSPYDYESRWELDDQRPFASLPLDCDGGWRVSERLEFVEDGEIYLIKPVG